MELSEIKNKKAKLQEKLKDMLIEFENETEVNVSSIDMEREYVRDFEGKAICYETKIKIEIKV